MRDSESPEPRPAFRFQTAESRCRQPDFQTLISRLSDLIAVTGSPHALAVQPEVWFFFLSLFFCSLKFQSEETMWDNISE